MMIPNEINGDYLTACKLRGCELCGPEEQEDEEDSALVEEDCE